MAPSGSGDVLMTSPTEEGAGGGEAAESDLPTERRSWLPERGQGAWPWIVYCLTSYIVLYPVLAAPVLADDFLNPFSQVDDGGVSLADGLTYGWDGATEGASFRLLGTLVGSFVNWALLWISATFDVSISTLYTAEKFVVLLACAAAAAWLWRVAAAALGRTVGVFTSTVFVSAALFCTLQIHAYWSNDPVANYPLVGFGGATLGLLVLVMSTRVVLRPAPWTIACATIVSVVAVSYYEMSIGAVMGAGLILLAGVRRHWADRVRRTTAIIGAASVVFAPLVLVTLGRRITGERASTYGGTTVRLGREAVGAFGYGMVGALPGTAWRLSIRSLGGTLGMVFLAIGVVVLLVWLAGSFIPMVASDARRDVASAPTTTTTATTTTTTTASPSFDGWLAGAFVAALVVYWCFAVAILSITVKVQDETLGFGYVYSSYAVGATIVALVLAVIAHAVVRQGPSPVRLLLGCIACGFVLVQLTINWRLAEQLNDTFQVNRRLLAAFDEDVPPPQRCGALTEWTSWVWPDYYEDGMTDGIQLAYQHYFGEPFCEGFVRPP